MSSTQLFEAALRLAAPWQVIGVDFDLAAKQLTLLVDFAPGTRFPHPDAPGVPRTIPNQAVAASQFLPA